MESAKKVVAIQRLRPERIYTIDNLDSLAAALRPQWWGFIGGKWILFGHGGRTYVVTTHTPLLVLLPERYHSDYGSKYPGRVHSVNIIGASISILLTREGR